jgi:hypothetical protein
MRYVRVNGLFAYQHHVKGELVELPNGGRYRRPDTDRLEVVEPGSVVPMKDDLAESFVARGLGVFCEGPENLIRPTPDTKRVERPGMDARPSHAERAVAPAQRA